MIPDINFPRFPSYCSPTGTPPTEIAMVRKKTLITLVIAGMLFAPAACRKQGPMEKAGERVDEIADNVKDGESPLKKKGAMEKAGEAIDDTLERHDGK